MRKNYVKFIAANGVIAALYAAVTLATPWAGYGPVQFRAAEILNILAFFNPGLAPGVAVGCLAANIISQYGILDIIFGPLATAAALFAITKTKNFYIASMWPAVANGAVIPFVIIFAGGLPLTLYNFGSIALSVAAGEFAVCAIAGSVIYRLALRDPGGAVRKALDRL